MYVEHLKTYEKIYVLCNEFRKENLNYDKKLLKIEWKFDRNFLHLPCKRINWYVRYVSKMLSKTAKDHPDYGNIMKTN